MRNFIKQFPFITIVFVIINIVLFYTTNTWENLTYDTTDLQNYKILTSMFAHQDAGHLWINMAMILPAGVAVELLIGRTKMITIMLIQELVVGYFAMNFGKAMITGGASGIGYALVVACLFAMVKSYVLDRRSSENWDSDGPSIMQVIAGGASIVMTLAIPMCMWDAWSKYNTLEGAANFAHFWAGIVGFVLGLVFSISTIKQAIGFGISHFKAARVNAHLNRQENARMREYWGKA
jgi:membrane associated rhomboid family serine protease